MLVKGGGFNMSLKDEITQYIEEAINTNYTVDDAYEVPSRDSLTFGATAKKLFVRAIYIDLRRSRKLLSENNKLMSLRAHKAFLYAVAKCMRAENGEPRSFNGDSVLTFFPGRDKNIAKQAVRAAMKTRYAIDDFINPSFSERYGYTLDYGIGIAQGDVYVGKSGVAGDEDFQDLIWIGWSVYHAVEYGESASKPKALWISKNVWNSINDDHSLTHSDGVPMWEEVTQSLSIGSFTVYRTSYRWTIN